MRSGQSSIMLSSCPLPTICTNENGAALERIHNCIYSKTRSYYRKGSAALRPIVLGIDYTKKPHLFKLPYIYTVCINLFCLIMQ